jgi:hypothetical protein
MEWTGEERRSHVCRPEDYLTAKQHADLCGEKWRWANEIVRESREDREELRGKVGLIEAKVVGQRTCDKRHEPIEEAIDEFKKIKSRIVTAAFFICIIVGGGMFVSYQFGNNTKVQISTSMKKDIELQRQISTTNCNALRAVLLKMGQDPPSCAFDGGR